jgi:phage tail sheath protein FI
MSSVVGLRTGMSLTVAGATTSANNGTFTITGISGSTVTVTTASGVNQAGSGGTVAWQYWAPIGVLTKKVSIYYQGALVETFDNLIGYDSTSPNFWETVIGTPANPVSQYVTVQYLGTGEQPANTYQATNYRYNPRLLMGNSVAVGDNATSSATVTTHAQAAGFDGSDPSNASYIGVAGVSPTGLQAFLQTEKYQINLVACPSISAAPVVQALIALAQTRADCVALIDPPFGLTPQEVTDWHNGQGIYAGDHSAFVSNYAALFWPWVKQLDPYSGNNVWVPPSGFMPGVFAYSDGVGQPWYAAAGITRGRVPNALDVEYHASKGDTDYFYGPGNGNAINPILSFAKDGICVYGNRTLQRVPSALDRINIRRLMILIETSVAASCRALVFEQNDPTLWRQFTALVTPFLQNLRGQRALDWFQVVCDSTTNNSQMLNNNEMGAKVYLIPTKTAEKIILNFTLLASGTNVTEFIANDSGQNLNS